MGDPLYWQKRYENIGGDMGADLYYARLYQQQYGQTDHVPAKVWVVIGTDKQCHVFSTETKARNYLRKLIGSDPQRIQASIYTTGHLQVNNEHYFLWSSKVDADE